MVRDSEFFTASLAVPLPARRVLHTSHPKDANRLGSDFSKSNRICNFVLLYTTLEVVRGGLALMRARRTMGVATARPSASVR